ncbi:MAG: WD40 repeat domain-containing protein [Limisphaerales bacterium]
MPRTLLPVVKLKTAHQIAFTTAEDRVAFFGDRYVSVQSVPSFQPIFAVRPIANPSDIDFSPDGSRLVVKGTSGHTIILDVQTGLVLSDFRNQKEGPGSAALFTSCSRYVVSVSWNGLLTVRDSATTEMVFSQLYEGGMLNDLSVPRDRRFFVYSVGYRASSDSEEPPPEAVVLRRWPMRAGDCRELPQRWSFIDALQVSPSGRLLAVIYGAPPETLEIYDIEQTRVIARRDVQFGGTGCSIGWSPDEQLLAINGNHRCYVLEMPKLSVRHEFPLQYCCHVGFSPLSRFLALGSWRESFIVPLDHLASFAESRRSDLCA